MNFLAKLGFIFLIGRMKLLDIFKKFKSQVENENGFAIKV